MDAHRTGERVRSFILGLIFVMAACASSHAEAPRDSIEVVYHPERLEYSIIDGGPARFVGGVEHDVYEFQASREDFRRIADLLEPLKANGLPCSQPTERSAPGYIVWREDGEEVRRVAMHTLCYSDGARPLARNADRAFRAMEEMGHERYAAPAIPDPAIITLQNMYWGNPTATWTIARGGQGRYVDPQRTVTFDVSAETFDRIREIFRPYEGRDFHCNRVVTDGPYGFVIWSSREGQEDQRTLWDAGCVSGDADDLFQRLDAVMTILEPLRDAGAPAR
jgi:hypothetical protein